jgi:hypothetical protein
LFYLWLGGMPELFVPPPPLDSGQVKCTEVK